LFGGIASDDVPLAVGVPAGSVGDVGVCGISGTIDGALSGNVWICVLGGCASAVAGPPRLGSPAECAVGGKVSAEGEAVTVLGATLVSTGATGWNPLALRSAADGSGAGAVTPILVRPS
jgi:hypothetical protein